MTHTHHYAPQAVRLSIELLSDLKALLHHVFGNERDLDMSQTASDQHTGSNTTPRSSASSSFSTFFSKSPTPQPPPGPSAWYAFAPTIKTPRRPSDDKVISAISGENANVNVKVEKAVGLTALDVSAVGSAGSIVSEVEGRSVSPVRTPSSADSTSPGSQGSGRSTPLNGSSPRPGTPLGDVKKPSREGPAVEDPAVPIFGLKVRSAAIALLCY
jgi:hypothetical protein